MLGTFLDSLLPSCTTNHPIPQGFSSLLLKPYIKAVAQFCEVEWWRPLMGECVTFFLLSDPTSDFTIIEIKCIIKINLTY